MAICPSCATTLTALPVTGTGKNLVCTGCKQHFYTTGGLLMRSPYVTGGSVGTTASSSLTITVSHGLQIEPDAGDIMVTPKSKVAQLSGASYYISATSTLNFVITITTPGAVTSGALFYWQYAKW